MTSHLIAGLIGAALVLVTWATLKYAARKTTPPAPKPWRRRGLVQAEVTSRSGGLFQADRASTFNATATCEALEYSQDGKHVRVRWTGWKGNTELLGYAPSTVFPEWIPTNRVVWLDPKEKPAEAA